MMVYEQLSMTSCVISTGQSPETRHTAAECSGSPPIAGLREYAGDSHAHSPDFLEIAGVNTTTA